MVRGKIITLEGVDSAGKHTQSNMLFEYLRPYSNNKLESMGFPDYESATGREIRAYLDGQRSSYSKEWLHTMYAANRYQWKKYIEEKLNEGYILVLDRYLESNIAYGAARGIDVTWLWQLDRYMPFSDLTIILDMPVGESSKRNNNPDVNEADLKYLKQVRSTFISLANSNGWVIINANRDKKEVHLDIVCTVIGRLGIG